MRTLLRYLHLTLVVARHGSAQLVWNRFARTPISGPQRLRRLLEAMGASFIKFGQLLSQQSDLLPRAYCTALFDLLDRVPPFPFSELERIFQQELGRGPQACFDEIERTPIASASIGQVHVARRDGRRLAVKVQRPSAEREFLADVRLMGAVATLVRRLHLRRWLWLARMIEEFVAWTHQELDYRWEARFMAALGLNARDRPGEVVPELVEELSTRRILVAELLDGPTVLDYLRGLEEGDEALLGWLEARGFSPAGIAQNIVSNFVSDAFRHGVFHADLHPANLLILPDNVVGYVDFGITGSLSPYVRRNLVALTLALTRADTGAMLTHFLRISRIDRTSDLAGFRDGLEKLTEEWFERTGSKRRLRRNFTMVMVEMLGLSRRTGVWPTPDVVRYLRSVITADGLIQRFAPGFDVSGLLEEICAELLRGEALEAWLSAESLADWTRTAARLVGEGPEAMVALLRKLTGGGQPVYTDRDRRGARSGRGGGRASLQLAAVGGLAGGVAALSEPVLGTNLFTASLLLTALASLLFLVSLPRALGA